MKLTQQQQILIDKLKYNFTKVILDNQKTFDICLGFAKSIHNFALSKSPLSFIEGGVRILIDLSQSLNAYSYQFFNNNNGWDKLICATYQKPLYYIIISVLKQHSFKQLQFRHENDKTVGIYTTPVGELGLDKYGIWFKSSDKFTQNEILEFLINEKLSSIKSNFFSITPIKKDDSKTSYNNYTYDLQGEDINGKESPNADFYVSYLNTFIERKINRSILFIGVPGTGKTTLAQTIISKFNFRTLKFKYDANVTDLDLIKFLVSSLKIEAIILDDFDQVSHSNNLLDFLSWVHDNTKLTILITNSLHPFHNALLRPGRIDQIISIDYLDEKIVLDIFGIDNQKIINKIKTWPIAYINELKARMIAIPDLNVDDHIFELEERVNAQANDKKLNLSIIKKTDISAVPNKITNDYNADNADDADDSNDNDDNFIEATMSELALALKEPSEPF